MKKIKCVILLAFVLVLLTSCRKGYVKNGEYAPGQKNGQGIWKCEELDIWFDTADCIGHMNCLEIDRDIRVYEPYLGNTMILQVCDNNGSFSEKSSESKNLMLKCEYFENKMIAEPVKEGVIGDRFSKYSSLNFILETKETVSDNEKKINGENYRYGLELANGKGKWECQELPIWFDTRDWSGHMECFGIDNNIIVSFSPANKYLVIYSSDNEIESKSVITKDMNTHYSFICTTSENVLTLCPRKSNRYNTIFEQFKMLTFVLTEQYEEAI